VAAAAQPGKEAGGSGAQQASDHDPQRLLLALQQGRVLPTRQAVLAALGSPIPDCAPNAVLEWCCTEYESTGLSRNLTQEDLMVGD
jgi:hypothetical protein